MRISYGQRGFFIPCVIIVKLQEGVPLPNAERMNKRENIDNGQEEEGCATR